MKAEIQKEIFEKFQYDFSEVLMYCQDNNLNVDKYISRFA